MVSKIFTAAALAGVASAACPLSVDFAGSTGHVAHVSVTNTGSEAVTVFKGNTVLTEQPTKDFAVSDHNGKDLAFKGIYANYRRTGLQSDMFQTIKPGETISTSVNVAKTFDLAGIPKAKVHAIQNFLYANGSKAPTALKGLQSCQATSSSPLDIIPDQSKVAADRISKRDAPYNSRIQKRDVSFKSSCSSDRVNTLMTSISDAISLASAASSAAANAEDNYNTWFIDTSYQSKVQEIYNDVVGVRNTGPAFSCTDDYSDCSSGTLLYTVPSDNVIIPCPDGGFWDFPELSADCANDDYDKGGSILHEMTHLYGTGDYAYGPDAAKQLPSDQASENADTYEMYAGSVRLGGCT